MKPRLLPSAFLFSLVAAGAVWITLRQSDENTVEQGSVLTGQVSSVPPGAPYVDGTTDTCKAYRERWLADHPSLRDPVTNEWIPYPTVYCAPTLSGLSVNKGESLECRDKIGTCVNDGCQVNMYPYDNQSCTPRTDIDWSIPPNNPIIGGSCFMGNCRPVTQCAPGTSCPTGSSKSSSSSSSSRKPCNTTDYPNMDAACANIGPGAFENTDAAKADEERGRYCTPSCEVSECSDDKDNEEFPDGTKGDAAFYNAIFGMSGIDEGDWGCLVDNGKDKAHYDPKIDSESANDPYNTDSIPTLKVGEWGAEKKTVAAASWWSDFLAAILELPIAGTPREMYVNECTNGVGIFLNKAYWTDWNTKDPSNFVDVKFSKFVCADTRPVGSATKNVQGATPPPPDATGAISQNCHDSCKANAQKELAAAGYADGVDDNRVVNVLEEWCVSDCFCQSSRTALVADITAYNNDCKAKKDKVVADSQTLIDKLEIQKQQTADPDERAEFDRLIADANQRRDNAVSAINAKCLQDAQILENKKALLEQRKPNQLKQVDDEPFNLGAAISRGKDLFVSCMHEEAPIGNPNATQNCNFDAGCCRAYVITNTCPYERPPTGSMRYLTLCEFLGSVGLPCEMGGGGGGGGGGAAGGGGGAGGTDGGTGGTTGGTGGAGGAGGGGGASSLPLFTLCNPGGPIAIPPSSKGGPATCPPGAMCFSVNGTVMLPGCSSSSRSSAGVCPANGCSLNGNAGNTYCASQGLTCQSTAALPCAVCVGSSRSSVASAACPMNGCALNGNAGNIVCQNKGMACESIAQLPCSRCVAQASSQVSSIPASSSRSSSRSSSSSSRISSSVSSSRSSSVSSASSVLLALACPQDACSANGNAGNEFCSRQGMGCVQSATVPCIRCVEGIFGASSFGDIAFLPSSSASSIRRSSSSARVPVLVAQEPDPVSMQFCGNGSLNEGEECDLGKDNSDLPNASCRTDCSLSRCGDRIVDGVRDEACDDGNATDGDGCSASCQLEQLAGQPEQTLPGSLIELPFVPGTPDQAAVIPAHGPVGDTGPEAVAIMAAGASAGYTWMKMRKKKQ